MNLHKNIFYIEVGTIFLLFFRILIHFTLNIYFRSKSNDFLLLKFCLTKIACISYLGRMNSWTLCLTLSSPLLLFQIFIPIMSITNKYVRFLFNSKHLNYPSHYILLKGIKLKRKIIGILVCLTMMMQVLSITAIANEPPSTPTIEGPTSGKPGVNYDYTFMSVDPEGGDVFIKISWGCCGPGQDFHTYGPFNSGEEAIIQKGYSETGTFSIQAYARDMDGAESSITILEVSMPKSKVFNFEFDLFEWLTERFPNVFQLLRLLQ